MSSPVTALPIAHSSSHPALDWGEGDWKSLAFAVGGAAASCLVVSGAYGLYWWWNYKELFLLHDYTEAMALRQLPKASTKLRVRVLDLDGSVPKQTQLLAQYAPTVHDLRAWGAALRIDTSFRLFWKYERELSAQFGCVVDDADGDSRPLVTFYGSNDYHHLALPLIRRFRQPFNLVLFDNHPDWFLRYAGLHCGTWFTQAASLPTVQQAFHFGGASNEFNDVDAHHPVDLLRSGKIASFATMDVWTGPHWEGVQQQTLRRKWFYPITEERLRLLLDPYRAVLARYPLYITYDKDVMHRTDNMQNWNSGKMSRAESLLIVRLLLEYSHNNLLAVDVCGDFSPVKVHGLYRHWLHKTQHHHVENDIDPAAALPNNQLSNLELLATLESCLRSQFTPPTAAATTTATTSRPASG